MPRPIVTAIVVSAIAWLIVMTVVLFAAGGGPGVVPEGWRLELLKTAAVVSFLGMLVAGVVAALVLERRRGR